MRALMLSSHPLADRAGHKVDILTGLLDRDVEVTVLYAGTRVRDYTGELRRRAPSDVRRIVARGSSPSAVTAGDRGLRSAALRLGVRVVSFPTLGDARALELVGRLQADVVLNLSALFIPTSFIDAAQHRVVGAHYAELPRIRGGDTVRWSILLDVPLVVSFQLLTGELDMGDVIGQPAVAVARGDDIVALRRNCQQTSVDGYLAVVERIRAGKLTRQPQRRSDGSTFFRMGTFLRSHVDELLAEGRYSHYGSAR